MRSIFLLLAMEALLTACGETHLDAGSNDGGKTDVVGELYQGTPSNSFGFDCSMPAPDSVMGTWVGQFDTYELPSGSNALRIEVKGYSPRFDGVCGTVVLGEGPPLPPTTDPSEFPPGIAPDPEIHSVVIPPREGFPYEILGSGYIELDAGTNSPPKFSGLQGDHLQFRIFPAQIINAWCEMQRSYKTETTRNEPGGGTMTPSYTCFPENALVPPTASGMPCDAGIVSGIRVRRISCAQARLCGLRYCACGGPSGGGTFADLNAKGCSANSLGAVFFDFHVDGEGMTGAVQISSGLELAHLTRQAAR